MIRLSAGVAGFGVAVSLCFRGGAAQYGSCTNGTVGDIGNGRCDAANNNPSCGFDGGDCCRCTCVDGPLYSCSDSVFDCVYPYYCVEPISLSNHTTCVEDWIGNGECDDVNLDPTCDYDGGDCCFFTPTIMGDGFCDLEDNNHAACAFDGGDCCSSTCEGPGESCGTLGYFCIDPKGFDPAVVAKFPDCTGYWGTVGDGVCNADNNTPSCGYDGGDCCYCSCAETGCPLNAFDCLDPDAGDEFYECEAPPPAVLPCPADVQRTWLVENSAQAQLLTEAVNCSGGSFEVEWRGRVVVDEPISLVNGTVLAVTGVGSSAAIDGGGSTRLFTVVHAELHLTGVDMSSGAGVVGGAIAATGSVVTLNRTNFVGNRAAGRGGAVYASDGSSVSCVEDGAFADNMSGKDGGAVYVAGSSTVSCGGSWRNNTAVAKGGALSADDRSSVSWGGQAVFADNTAGRHGGALAGANSSNFSWSGTTSFSGNEAAYEGGAVYVFNSSAASSTGDATTTFSGNFAGSGGAAAVVTDSIMSLEGNTSFYGNKNDGYPRIYAPHAGGAVNVEYASLTWSGYMTFSDNEGEAGGAIGGANASIWWSGETTLARNNATRFGGGAFALQSCTVSWVGQTSIVNNSADYDGGAFMLHESSVSWSGNTTLAYNSAGSSGGAMSLSDGWSTSGTGSSVSGKGTTLFVGNTAGLRGGALSMEYGSEASWAGHTEFLDNTGYFGGAIGLDESHVSWSGNTTLARNRALNFSGGALSMGSLRGGLSSASWTGTTLFLENSAEFHGGAIEMESSSVSWSGNTTLAYNRARYAGAIHLAFGFGSLYGGSNVSWGGGTTRFLGNNASLHGGALHLEDGAEVSWTGDTDFVGNSADTGGALYVETSEASWAGRTAFVDNWAGSSGGVIHITNDSFVGWTGDTEFVSNEARTGNGGVVGTASLDSAGANAHESTLGVNGTTHFVNNTCGANGGALALHGGLLLDIGSVNVSFSGNFAQVAGGAVFVSGTDVGPVFTGVSFISNSAQVGGAVSAVGSGNFREENSYTSDTFPTTFYQCEFIDNSATATGGAIESAAGQDLIDSTIFRGNEGRVGGALRLAGTANLYDCSFVENASDDAEGAAVSNIGSIVEMGNINFSRNVFDCQPGMFLNYTANNTASGDLYGTVCNGCPSACQDCVLEDAPWVPTCSEVLDHSTSPGGNITMEMLSIERGYWRATPTSAEVLRCYHADACLGGVTGSAGYCLEGHEGPYCAVCGDGYTAELGFACSKCSDRKGGLVLAAIFGVVGLLVVAAVVSHVTSGKTGRGEKGLVERLTQYIPLQSVKIVVVAWQILTQFTSVANVTFPDVYQRFLDSLDLFNFDLGWILSAGCVLDIDFHDRLLISTVAPLVGLLLLAGTYATSAFVNRGAPETLNIIWNKHVSMALLLTFFVYSSVSAVLFKTFACDKLDDGRNLLRADYRIECDSAKHQGWQVYAGFMTLLYAVGIPALYSGLLFADREVLQKGGAGRDSGSTARIAWTADLWKPYKPSVFFYEVIECVRRILLAGVVVFIYPNTAAQIAITLMMAFAFALLAESLAPYACKWDRWLSRTGHVVVFTSMYVALLLKVDVTDERAGSQKVFEAVLVAAHGCMVVVIVVESIVIACSLRVEPREEPSPRFSRGKVLARPQAVAPVEGGSPSREVSEDEAAPFG